MSVKFKNIFKICACLLLLISLFITPVVRADSAWDSDYDSGGSWDSGSSWDSDSGWDSGSSWDSDYSSGSSHSGDGDFSIIAFIIFICVLSFVLDKNNKRSSTSSKSYKSTFDSYEDISQEHFYMTMPDSNLESLKKMAYDNFVTIQNAWMNFDYDTLRKHCTDELYNSYVSQLETLKLKQGKNIMNGFEHHITKVIDVDEANDEYIVSVFMSVSFYDYVVNVNSNKVIRGNKNRKITNNYILTYVVQASKSEKDEKCPHCGAPIEFVTSGKCEYCNSTIVKKASKFVLSKKTNVNK